MRLKVRLPVVIAGFLLCAVGPTVRADGIVDVRFTDYVTKTFPGAGPTTATVSGSFVWDTTTETLADIDLVENGGELVFTPEGGAVSEWFPCEGAPDSCTANDQIALTGIFYQAILTETPSSFSVLMEGLIGESPGPDPEFSAGQYTLGFSVDGGSLTSTAVSNTLDGQSFYGTDLTISEVGPVSTPEPPTVALLGIGLLTVLAIAFARIKRSGAWSVRENLGACSRGN
jgi:hypothetical protein